MTENCLALKPLEEADFPAILPLIERLYEHEYIPFDAQRVANTLRPLLHDPALGRAWLIQSADTTAGYAIVTHVYSIELGGDVVIVDELYVAEEFRRQGLARFALSQIETYALQRNAVALQLEVEHDNSRAQTLYTSTGFSANHRHLMVKRLA